MSAARLLVALALALSLGAHANDKAELARLQEQVAAANVNVQACLTPGITPNPHCMDRLNEMIELSERAIALKLSQCKKAKRADCDVMELDLTLALQKARNARANLRVALEKENPK